MYLWYVVETSPVQNIRNSVIHFNLVNKTLSERCRVCIRSRRNDKVKARGRMRYTSAKQDAEIATDRPARPLPWLGHFIIHRRVASRRVCLHTDMFYLIIVGFPAEQPSLLFNSFLHATTVCSQTREFSVDTVGGVS